VGKWEFGLEVSDVVGKSVGSFVGLWVGDLVGTGVGRPDAAEGGPKDVDVEDDEDGCFCLGSYWGGTGLGLVVRTDKGVSGSIQSA
jgi:hypothetical protein